MEEKKSEAHAYPNIYQKIHAIMAELDYIQKGSAKVNNQYRFVSHDQVTAAIHPLLVKHRVVIIPNVSEIHQEGNRTAIKLEVVFRNIDDPTDSFFSVHVGYGIDTGDKGPGKAISYAYKYALLKTFCLETGDDPDNDAEAVYEPKPCSEFFEELNVEDADKAAMEEFVKYSAGVMNKHPEDIKREALNRKESFVNAFSKWKTKVKK